MSNSLKKIIEKRIDILNNLFSLKVETDAMINEDLMKLEQYIKKYNHDNPRVMGGDSE
jgi:hypothetical protein